MSNLTDPAPAEPIPECPHCQKPMPLCICDSVTPIENRLSLLILQHPQEQDRALGTARLLAKHFADATVRVGLSWPSLSKALGRPVENAARWAVLYLGSARAADLEAEGEIVALNRKGEIAENQRAILGKLEGVVLLDGTWSQAKALWWRNPWMLKCQRVILNPAHPSRYGRLRKEPRSDGLSTIEAAATILAGLERRPDIAEILHASFERLLTRYREVQAEMPELAPKPAPKGRRRDFRRRKRA
ncbi:MULTISPECIES: tRNA-uridine aminocarboxypropyltransferase [Bradyrhizobium]|uniref:tRNA-uridine aminocarboxypropyltransferase n=1 Tax=Bradyrhizobium TaxID=374 RepID=UPI00048452E9|nr:MULTISPECIES: tRNA-uridine aminocarboxypropyltransferase [Bradyrhizobium]QOG20369.1 DTW domain-containing protein [Bradyrhizobium sp. SEMIA]UFW45279.1 DTW domain-containing protein [Bradyrhizobium arachidis]